MIYGNCRSIELVNRIEHRMFHILVIFFALEWQMYHYVLTIYGLAYPF